MRAGPPYIRERPARDTAVNAARRQPYASINSRTRDATATVVTSVSTSSPADASNATTNGTDPNLRIASASRCCRARPSGPRTG